eukprot:3983065-Amphidinium_carterae.1
MSSIARKTDRTEQTSLSLSTTWPHKIAKFRTKNGSPTASPRVTDYSRQSKKTPKADSCYHCSAFTVKHYYSYYGNFKLQFWVMAKTLRLPVNCDAVETFWRLQGQVVAWVWPLWLEQYTISAILPRLSNRTSNW